MEQFEQFKKNYCIFNGFLSSDPEVKYFDSGKVVCNFSIPLKNKKDKEPVWLNCETWNQKLVEYICNYKKNDEVTVIGYLLESKYNDKKYFKFNVKVIM